MQRAHVASYSLNLLLLAPGSVWNYSFPRALMFPKCFAGWHLQPLLWACVGSAPTRLCCDHVKLSTFLFPSPKAVCSQINTKLHFEVASVFSEPLKTKSWSPEMCQGPSHPLRVA